MNLLVLYQLIINWHSEGDCRYWFQLKFLQEFVKIKKKRIEKKTTIAS